MLRLLFFLFFIFYFSFAIDINQTEVPLHKSIEISQSVKNIEEAILKPETFTKHKYFRRYIRKKVNNDNLWLKIDIENNSSKIIKRELFSRWSNTELTLYLVKDKKVIHKEKLQNHVHFFKSKPFELQAYEKLDFYLNVKVLRALDDYYYLHFLAPENSLDFIVDKERYFHNGLFIGLLIAMMMYNFFMYFSINMKCYLYLALYQGSILLYVSDLRTYLILVLEDFPNFSFWFFKIFLSFLISILSILFTKRFLNTKKEMPIIDKILTFSIFILAFFQLNPLYVVNYAALLYSLYFIAGVYSFIKGNNSALFYIFGFTPTALFLIGINMIKYLDLNIYFEYQSAIQVFAVIEAFALSMALYLKVKAIVTDRKRAQEEAFRNEKVMLVQSRFATMGEMMAAIAHQWRQPLNHLSMIFANLQLANESNKLDNSYLNKKTEEANLQLKYMSETIEDFTNFVSKKGKIVEFTLDEVVKYSMDLVNSRCKKLKIDTRIESYSSKIHKNYKNELIQVLVTILNNAVDALMLNNIEDRKIDIFIEEDRITVIDNAGGIPENIIEKIFNPYFSTKDKKFGTGLGLYTAKTIVDNLIKGELIVKNVDNGASFSIKISQFK